jgi:hypothetical protein
MNILTHYQRGRLVAAAALFPITIVGFMLPIFLGVEWGIMNSLWALAIVFWAVSSMVGGGFMIAHQLWKAAEAR